jgi:hypothetical protein
MKTRSIEMLLRLFVLLTLLFAAATPSGAETRQIAKVSASQLKSTCDKVGGTFGPTDGGGYYCDKHNCDGKGGSCTVTCGETACYGITPRAFARNQTLNSLLQNGDRVPHDLDPAPTDLLVAPGEGSAAARAAPADPAPGTLY